MLHHARRAHAAPARATNVGARIASIVGRDGELAAVVGALRRHRIVTLVGPAGVGKTTLASEASRALLGAMPDGAWLVELAPLRSAARCCPRSPARWACAASAPATTTATATRSGSCASASTRARLLVVLDNAEHLVPDLGAVARALAATGDGVSVLVTSRRPLGLAGEAVVPVRPLAADSAEELFLARAAAARPDWVGRHGRARRGRADLPPARRAAAGGRAGRRTGARAVGRRDRGAARARASACSAAAARWRRRSRPATRC